MGKVLIALRFLLVSIAISTYLSACGGSGSSSTNAAFSTTKTAAWTNVSVRALDSKVNINWDKATGSSFGTELSTYNVYCATVPVNIVQAANRIAANYAGTSFDHTNVTNGQRYYYAVTAVNAVGEGPASLTVSAVPYQVLPAAPFGLKVTALDSAIKLDFLVPTPVNTTNINYNLYRSETINGFTSASKIASLTTTTYEDKSKITNDKTYYYALTTVVAGKESEFSPISVAHPQARTAAVDSSATALAKFASIAEMTAEAGAGSCSVTWSDVTALTITPPDPAASTNSVKPYYVLYWSDSPDVLNNIRDKVVDVSKALNINAGFFTYKLSGLTNGSLYYFQIVAAIREADGSLKLDPQTGIPLRKTAGPVVAVTPGLKIPAAPAAISATQGAQQVSLNWTKDSSGLGGITYNIYVSTTDAGSPAELMAKGIKKNSDDSTKAYYVHSGLLSGQTYYYVVTAVGEAESAPSSIVSVTL
jgi:fibronectin type 3 domain-containing protein